MMAMHSQVQLRGELRLNEPMARHTSWRAGGNAARFYRPADIEDLAAFVRAAPTDEPMLWIGLGSNLLVRDGGLRGAVIATQATLAGLSKLNDHVVRAEAGVACAKVARFCARRGLAGGEFLAGIPGTIGGALAMNAGAFGAETWERVVEVETMARDGSLRTRTPHEYQIDYRSVRGPSDEWFVAAHLSLEDGAAEVIHARIKALLEQRGHTQPIGAASCGSVFRNPPGDYAARLIESAGLKGVCIGAACVSEKHANFIVNNGGARATDIEALIRHVRDVVERHHGVRLQTEVRIVGQQAVDGGER